MATVREIIEGARRAQDSLAGAESSDYGVSVDRQHSPRLLGDISGALASAPASEYREMTEFVWPKDLPQHLSWSQASTHETCPEQYRLSYVRLIKAPPKGYLVIGSADHKTVAQNMEQKIESHVDLPLNEMRERYVATLDEIVDEANGEVEWETFENRNKAQKAGLELVSAYHEVASPRVQPVTVERKIELSVPGVSVPVIGYVDIEETGNGIERKTTGRKVSVPQSQWEGQGLLYAMAIGKPMHYHVSTRTKTAAVYTPVEEPGLHLARDAASDALVLGWLRQKALQIFTDYMTYGPDEPWPTTRFRRQTACSWCGYRFAGKCVAWGGSADG